MRKSRKNLDQAPDDFAIASAASHLLGSFADVIGIPSYGFLLVSGGIRDGKWRKDLMKSQSEYCVPEMLGMSRIRAIPSWILGFGWYC